MLEHIELFIKLCEAKSIKACAELINVYPSTISKRISELEETLGKMLVIRTSKRFELTEYGQHVYNNCKHIPMFVEKVVYHHENGNRHKEDSGVINIALGAAISNRLICPYLNEFIDEYPNIGLNISYHPGINTWLDHKLDLILASEYIRDKDLTNRFVRHEYLQLYCNSSYAIRYGIPRTIDELSQHRIISGLTPDLSPIEYVKFYHKKTKEEHVLDLSNNKLNMSNHVNTIQVGLNTDCIFGTFEALVINEVRSGTLIPVLSEWHAHELDFYIVTKKIISPETQLFIDFIYDCMRNTRY